VKEAAFVGALAQVDRIADGVSLLVDSRSGNRNGLFQVLLMVAQILLACPVLPFGS
jgi:hypothetical protein